MKEVIAGGKGWRRGVKGTSLRWSMFAVGSGPEESRAYNTGERANEESHQAGGRRWGSTRSLARFLSLCVHSSLEDLVSIPSRACVPEITLVG